MESDKSETDDTRQTKRARDELSVQFGHTIYIRNENAKRRQLFYGYIRFGVVILPGECARARSIFIMQPKSHTSRENYTHTLCGCVELLNYKSIRIEIYSNEFIRNR